MYDPKHFYKAYLVDHYVYKIASLRNILDNYGELKELVLDGVTDINDKDYTNSLRAEIRMTYFHAVETLFEMMFALEPEDGHYMDLQIWERLADSNWKSNGRRIEQLADGNMEFLDRKVGILHYANGSGREITLLEYVFFFSASEPEIEDQILTNLPAIRKAVGLFAKDFTERDEYNALKHGLRIFPTITKFAFGVSGTGKFPFSMDLSSSMTFPKFEKDHSLTLHTRPLDTERDTRMTYLCSALIQNIVRTRRVKFFIEEGLTENIVVPTMEEVDEASKPTVSSGTLRLNLKPIGSSKAGDNEIRHT